jgi:hypothetical protein
MFSYVLDVPGPIQMYSGMHKAITDRVAGRDVGLLLHLGRETETGFQITEIWTSREHFDRFNIDVVVRLMNELFGQNQLPDLLPITEFEPSGLIIPTAGIEA